VLPPLVKNKVEGELVDLKFVNCLCSLLIKEKSSAISFVIWCFRFSQLKHL
jgi:hypothetical protein